MHKGRRQRKWHWHHDEVIVMYTSHTGSLTGTEHGLPAAVVTSTNNLNSRHSAGASPAAVGWNSRVSSIILSLGDGLHLISVSCLLTSAAYLHYCCRWIRVAVFTCTDCSALSDLSAQTRLVRESGDQERWLSFPDRNTANSAFWNSNSRR